MLITRRAALYNVTANDVVVVACVESALCVGRRLVPPTERAGRRTECTRAQ